MSRKTAVLVFCAVLIGTSCVFGQDWPQWRGVNRDAKATLTAPKTWPKELNKKWTIQLGIGTDSTPALVSDKLYVFTRVDANETIVCLDAATGKEVWRDGCKGRGIPGGGSKGATGWTKRVVASTSPFPVGPSRS